MKSHQIFVISSTLLRHETVSRARTFIILPGIIIPENEQRVYPRKMDGKGRRSGFLLRVSANFSGDIRSFWGAYGFQISLCQEKAGVGTVWLRRAKQGKSQSFVSNFVENILLFWSFHVSIAVWLKYTKQDSENENGKCWNVVGIYRTLIDETSVNSSHTFRTNPYQPYLTPSSCKWAKNKKWQSHYKLSFFCLVTPISTPNSWNPHI